MARHIVLLTGVLVAFGMRDAARAYDWRSIGPRDGVARIVALDADQQRLYAVTNLVYLADTAIYSSDDGGATWVPTGPLAMTVLGLATDPSTPGTLYASGYYVYDCGLHCQAVDVLVTKSVDAAASWSIQYVETFVNGIPFGKPSFVRLAVVVDPMSPQIVHVGGYLRSVDGGATWLPVTGLPNSASAVVVDPSDSSVVYASVVPIPSGSRRASMAASPGRRPCPPTFPPTA